MRIYNIISVHRKFSYFRFGKLHFCEAVQIVQYISYVEKACPKRNITMRP